AATRQKAFQRVAGTIIGGAVAAGVSALFGGTGVVTALVFVFTALCVALLPVNYGAYAIFGTPAFVLLAEASVGNWHLAGLRVINTLIGGTLALIGSRLLWPVDEWNRLPQHIAATIRGDVEYLKQAARVAREGPRAFGTLREVRRTIALAAANAEDSLQRLLSDHKGPSEELEPIMACLVYARRLGAAIAGLALAGEAGVPVADVDRFVETNARALDDLADAIVSHRAPAELPRHPERNSGSAVQPSPALARMRRIARQVRLLHDAAERWMASALN
ncbi:MAG: FUSC family protein, partial [Gemmatimonadaceae bacterium]